MAGRQLPPRTAELSSPLVVPRTMPPCFAGSLYKLAHGKNTGLYGKASVQDILGGKVRWPATNPSHHAMMGSALRPGALAQQASTPWVLQGAARHSLPPCPCPPASQVETPSAIKEVQAALNEVGARDHMTAARLSCDLPHRSIWSPGPHALLVLSLRACIPLRGAATAVNTACLVIGLRRSSALRMPSKERRMAASAHQQHSSAQAMAPPPCSRTSPNETRNPNNPC